MRKTEIRVEPVESFFSRGRRVARLADRRERIPESRVIAFEEATDLLRLFTPKRVLLLREIREAPGSISDLARRLKRDRSAVTRDVQLLERCGAVRVTGKPLPGHGRQKWITPAGRRIELRARL